jgi:SAM-dependent methyltransferase
LPASSYETAVQTMRERPHMREFVARNFLDEDLHDAVARYAREKEFETVVRALRAAGAVRVLDLGAGRGLTSLALLRAGFQVVSVEADASEVVGIRALSRYCLREGGRPVQGDILRLPFGPGEFDAAMCRSVLHHLDDLSRGLAEIARVLKPGGVFIALGEHLRSVFSRGAAFQAAHPAVALGVEERAYPLVEYWWRLRRNGFAHVALRGYGEALDFASFAGVRARSVRPTASGLHGPVLRVYHAAHVMKRRYSYWLRVPEDRLPVTHLIARKAGRGSGHGEAK